MTTDTICYEYGSSRATCLLFVLSRVVAFRKVRFLFRDFFVKMWLAKALLLSTFPVAVRLKRFNAPLFVFILGMMNVLYFGTMSIDISFTSMVGTTSTRPISLTCFSISSRSVRPKSVWDRSRPRNTICTFTLSP